METDDRRRAPPGEFRVVGYDQYDYSDYVVGDFATPEEAGRVARARAASPNGTPTSFSDLFFVYDDQGTCLERVTYDELQEGGPPGAAGELAVRSAPGGEPVEARRELLEVLRQARALLARPGNDFDRSPWGDAPAALAELDRQSAAVESGDLPPRLDLAVLFAPTGPIQEVSLSSGWAQEFLAAAARFDAAAERVYA